MGVYFFPCKGYRVAAKWEIDSTSYLESINASELYKWKVLRNISFDFEHGAKLSNQSLVLKANPQMKQLGVRPYWTHQAWQGEVFKCPCVARDANLSQIVL